MGIVGCKLLYPDATVQHAGAVVGIQGVAAHCHVHAASNDPGFQGLNRLTREVCAVTGACMAVRRAAFDGAGGFDVSLAVAFNDVALCMAVVRAGLRIICLSDPIAFHHESKSRGYDTTPEKKARFQSETIRFNLVHRPRGWFDEYDNLNLDMHRIHTLGSPPRLTRSWRRFAAAGRKPRVLFLSITYQVGHGVPVVVAEQARRLLADGYEVILGGPLKPNEMVIGTATRVVLDTAADAAGFAVTSEADLVCVHTPPFFGVMKYLVGGQPDVILYDYGEPPPALFPDHEARVQVNRDKALCFALASHRAAISAAVAAEAGDPEMVVLPLANSHLGRWDEAAAARRVGLRAAYGWTDAFVILNVCRFQRGDRFYKGIDRYTDIGLRAKMAARSRPVVVVMCGKANPDDVADLREAGLTVFANVSDRELLNLYIAADVYMNLSQWEGYNLGIAQALAMGLPTLASKSPAHDAFGIPTFAEDEALLAHLLALIEQPPAERRPVVWEWSESLDVFSRYVSDIIGAPVSVPAAEPPLAAPGVTTPRGAAGRKRRSKA